MLAFAIDRGDQFRKGRASLLGDLFQTVPELVFKADARLAACNDNRALRNQRLHGFSPRTDDPLLNRCANNFNLWPEQHSQRQATQGNFWQPQRGSGENRCGSRGPLDLHPAVQGPSQSGPSRISQTDPAQAQCISLLIADCDVRDNALASEYPRLGCRACTPLNAAACGDELGMGA